MAVTRRRMLASAAVAASVGLSGCLSGEGSLRGLLGGDGASLSDDSECFERVGFNGYSILFENELSVELHTECEADFVIALGGGKQIGSVGLKTGERKTVVGIGDWSSDLELLAVVGGQQDSGGHAGGDIIERVDVEVSD